MFVSGDNRKVNIWLSNEISGMSIKMDNEDSWQSTPWKILNTRQGNRKQPQPFNGSLRKAAILVTGHMGQFHKGLYLKAKYVPPIIL